MPDNDKKDILLYVDSHLDNNKNKYILEATLNYIKNSERFSGSFFEYRFFLFAFFIQSIPTLNLTIKYHSFSMHIVYYYLFFTLFIDLYFDILILPPATQNYVGALLYAFVVLFSFCVSHYYREKTLFLY